MVTRSEDDWMFVTESVPVPVLFMVSVWVVLWLNAMGPSGTLDSTESAGLRV